VVLPGSGPPVSPFFGPVEYLLEHFLAAGRGRNHHQRSHGHKADGKTHLACGPPDFNIPTILDIMPSFLVEGI